EFGIGVDLFDPALGLGQRQLDRADDGKRFALGRQHGEALARADVLDGQDVRAGRVGEIFRAQRNDGIEVVGLRGGLECLDVRLKGHWSVPGYRRITSAALHQIEYVSTTICRQI